MRRTVHLATEDELSEAVAERLIAELGGALDVGLRFRQGGYGYLKRSIDKFRQMSRLAPVLLLTDLDKNRCPASLIEDWCAGKPVPGSLLFRVAVHEVESWLLADHDAIRGLMNTQIRLPEFPDELADPKRYLLELAKRAPRDVSADLLPRNGAFAGQGLGYNSRLRDLVRRAWSPERAAPRSESLRRTRDRLKRLAENPSGDDSP